MVAVTHRVSEAEAAARLPELLDRVAAGEAVEIARGQDVVFEIKPGGRSPAGKAEAPPPDSPVAIAKQIRAEFAGIFGDMTLDEIMAWKHDDHLPERRDGA